MPKEKAPSAASEIYDLETLSAQTKMRYLLEIFDLGKDKAANELRKENFLGLMRKYFEFVHSKNRSKTSGSDSDRRKVHDEIMGILDKISLSTGLSETHRELVDYLKTDRYRVERMITSYFSGFNTGDSRQHDELHQALRGDGLFTSPPGKENE